MYDLKKNEIPVSSTVRKKDLTRSVRDTPRKNRKFIDDFTREESFLNDWWDYLHGRGRVEK